MREKNIAAVIHGRYLLKGKAGERPKLLVGFHGYGEIAEAHLAHLLEIPGVSDWLVCSVQSLHLFYNAKSGDVVGSWMTKLGREQMIADNIRYVAGVVAEVSRETGPLDKLVFAGFSQGVAMTYRAAAHCGFPCDGVIALAGDVPPELADLEGLRLPPVLLGRGAADTWYTEEKMDADVAALRILSPSHETCVFDGGHQWSAEFLARCGQFLANR